VVAYWPALIRRDRVAAEVRTFAADGAETARHIEFPVRGEMGEPVTSGIKPRALSRKPAAGALRTVQLRRLCYARSGDKGDTSNIGVLARSPRIYEWLAGYLTAARVKKFFGPMVKGPVTRYRLDNLEGLNFLLEGALGGGGTTSLLVDPQGKTLSQALLQMDVQVPSSLLRGLD
jgi:hypothetical protein